MIFIKQKPDDLGALASTLCLLHCIATPFLFLAQSCAIHCSEDAPVWWRLIDYFFLVVSFFAVYRSTQTTSSAWMKPALWASWGVLFFVIINEKMAWFPIPEYGIYMPALALIVLHLYNRTYCQCNSNTCCTHET
ncbi:MerC domain-containing protein [Formosa sediminum]|uniref:MerC domain-containing protein n=1 Tax=Formosa sediminum TaxID=2594004 RepID=A0A516GSF0_9FLAO|nr:MerC domain-containing protein [Formosa sediminum]QDO94444.1 MerC domain-containing protein [Formosa sediminum]